MLFYVLQKMKSLSRPKWYVVLGASFAIGLVAFVAWVVIQIRFEENLPTYFEHGGSFPVDDLPPTSTDVRLYKSATFAPWGRAYEFKCTEAEYRNWVAKKRTKDSSLSVIRTERNDMIPTINKSGEISFEALDVFLVSDWKEQDSGYYLVYDPKNGRAVTWSHSR